MKNLLRLEEVALLALTIYFNSLLPYPGWLYWILFLTPDVGMLGYLVNTNVGAMTYNLLHHKGLAIGIWLAGLAFASMPLQFTGLLLLGHSSFDRIVGYGLKYPDQFQHTHLGWIGQPRKSS